MDRKNTFLTPKKIYLIIKIYSLVNFCWVNTFPLLRVCAKKTKLLECFSKCICMSFILSCASFSYIGLSYLIYSKFSISAYAILKFRKVSKFRLNQQSCIILELFKFSNISSCYCKHLLQF